MAALVEAARAPGFPAKIVLVLSNRPDASGLAVAQAAGIPTGCVDHQAFSERLRFEQALDAELRAADVDLVCLAGFMRVLTPWFIERWDGRLLNIHPSLLPSFRGLHTHERALRDGVTLHGCSVHFVVPELDAGPIVAQAAVPVLRGDTPDSLAARVLSAEHRLYPAVLAWVAAGRARLVQGRVESDAPAPDGVFANPRPD